jgi:hypothetical protein
MALILARVAVVNYVLKRTQNEMIYVAGRTFAGSISVRRKQSEQMKLHQLAMFEVITALRIN